MGLSSIYTGISGLSAYSTAMSVIGNNLANVNTNGFKASRVSFADIMSQSLISSTGEYQVGRGVEMASVVPQFAQGSFETTSSPTDMAIDGDGFFIVRGNEGIFYTRAGNYIFNSDGEMVNPDGYTLQGWLLDDNENISGSLGNINISAISSAPSATSSVELRMNLDAGASVITTPWDAQNPHSTSNYSTSLTVYDSLGKGHMATAFFRKASDNTWNYYSLVGGDQVGSTAQYVQCGSGTLTFTNSGALNQEAGGAATFNWTGGAAAGSITFDFGTSLTEDPGGTGLEGTTQFAGASSTLFQNQNGYSSGHLVNISVNTEGKVTGLFSNGNSKAIYMMALANFKSPWELDMVGKNLFAESQNSGQSIIGAPGTSDFGKIASNSLEMSNVDIATEFVNMIKTQQAFQANSKVITTTDQMLQELINLKR